MEEALFGYSGESVREREFRVLAFWEREGILAKILSRKGQKFVHYDGPPFATGLPHYGHMLTSTIKDVILRYWTMRGYSVDRRFGWDCHGLPVENEVEKSLNLTVGSGGVERFGISVFNDRCREVVLKCAGQWREWINRMGRWVDFDGVYSTMDLSYMESVWWVFRRLWDMGLIYEGYKVMPVSTLLGTPLSNFEANLNYKEVEDPAIVVEFPILDSMAVFLVWTTTPWTLPSNVALMVGRDVEYVKVRDRGKEYIIGSERCCEYFRDGVDILERFNGSALAGMVYEPLFKDFVGVLGGDGFRVICSEGVSCSEGTGIVHAAPAFGEIDFYSCQKEGLGIVCPVDRHGRFTREFPEFEGTFVKDANIPLIDKIESMGRLFLRDKTIHRYPFCWRSDTELIYLATRTWFFSVESIKDVLIKANKSISWAPDHLKFGRFGKWLEDARDWAIGRNRYWGTPIPLWRGDNGDLVAIGSIGELEERSGVQLLDIHRDSIDCLSFVEGGIEYRRVEEVFDCWFESGAMPYAQNHYPFENKKKTEAGMPADFVAEGLDQTRGWFYTLNVLSSALFGKAAFKHVVVNGIILAKDGAKMSKKLKNYPDLGELMDKHGADAIRFYLMGSKAVCGDDLMFSEDGVCLALRQVLLPIWNGFHFLSLYANIYGWVPQVSDYNQLALLPLSNVSDKWLLSMLQKLVHEVDESLRSYNLIVGVPAISSFVDQLTNGYIRYNRRRFWDGSDVRDRNLAFEVLYWAMKILSMVIAPFMPFISEALYLGLKTNGDPLSVHMCAYPHYISQFRDVVIERGMVKVRTLLRLGFALRKAHHVKVRQPLSKMYVVSADQEVLVFVKNVEALVLNEVNVKSIEYSNDPSAFLECSLKLKFKKLGPRLGSKMPHVKNMVKSMDANSVVAANGCTLQIDEEMVFLSRDDFEITYHPRANVVALSGDGLTVALVLELDHGLKMEGIAREIINKVNLQRKKEGLLVTDRIVLSVDGSDRINEALDLYRGFICGEVLAKEIRSTAISCVKGDFYNLNGEEARIAIEVVAQ